MKKQLKKKLRRKTVEAYACASCMTPDHCAAGCSGDLYELDAIATFYAGTSAAKT